MKCKTFEVRDRATFIPVLAVKLEPVTESDRYLLARSGYGLTPKEQSQYVQVSRIYGGLGDTCCDPYDWDSDARTMRVAHQYIIAHFDKLESGAVVDVEFILGETTSPKLSEQTTVPFGEEMGETP